MNETLKQQIEELDDEERTALSFILKELAYAKYKHPAFSKNDLMYGAAIVAEESGELTRATILFVHEDQGSLTLMKKEAGQTGATALRMLTLIDDRLQASFYDENLLACNICKGKGHLENGECIKCKGTGLI